MRRIAVLTTVFALGLAFAAAQAKSSAPDATLRLSGGSVAAGVGVHWAKGTRTYKDKQYPVTVRGLSVGDVGVTAIEASGKVFNLASLDDFDGNYTALGGGATAAGGVDVAAMKNQNGVTVELVSTTQGVRVAVGGAGVEMTIEK